jgi:hypothetical protein
MAIFVNATEIDFSRKTRKAIHSTPSDPNVRFWLYGYGVAKAGFVAGQD